MINLDNITLKKMGIRGKEYAQKEFSKRSLLKKLNNHLIETSEKFSSDKYG